MKPETLQEISDLISILIIDVPFCMQILNLQIKECSDRLASTDGKYIYINEELWQNYNKREKLAIIFHEWMHVSLFHPKRAKGKVLRTWGFAADFVVDAIIEENMSNMDLPDGSYYDPSFSNKCVEEIYEYLYTESQKKKQEGNLPKLPGHKNQGSKGNGNKPGQGNGTCDKNDAIDQLAKGEYPGGLSDDLLEESLECSSSEQELKEEILKAAENHKKIKGSLPAFYQRIITEIKKSKAPWQQIFHSLVKQVIYSGGIRSYAHPKSWAWIFGIALPGENSYKKPNIVLIYDTSGSIGQNELNLFNNEVKKVLTLCDKCTIITSDTIVHEQVRIRKISQLVGENAKVKFRGGGGTCFISALKAACSLHPDLIIYLTDGYGNFGKKPKNLPKLLWVINNDYVKPPFGKYICIK